MAALGKMIFGFMIIGICIVGALMIFAQQNTTPLSSFNIGSNSDYTNSTSMINSTAQLVSKTTSFGTTSIVIILFILAGLIIIGALALIAGRTK